MDPGMTEIRDRADAGAYAELMSLIDELSGIRASMLALAGRALEGSVRGSPDFSLQRQKPGPLPGAATA